MTVGTLYPDFAVEDLPESGEAVPVLVDARRYPRPFCDWAGPTGRAPECAASAWPGPAARRVGRAGGIGPGCQDASRPEPARPRRRAACPVPALVWRLSVVRASGRPGPGGRGGGAGGGFGVAVVLGGAVSVGVRLGVAAVGWLAGAAVGGGGVAGGGCGWGGAAGRWLRVRRAVSGVVSGVSGVSAVIAGCPVRTG